MQFVQVDKDVVVLGASLGGTGVNEMIVDSSFSTVTPYFIMVLPETTVEKVKKKYLKKETNETVADESASDQGPSEESTSSSTSEEQQASDEVLSESESSSSSSSASSSSSHKKKSKKSEKKTKTESSTRGSGDNAPPNDPELLSGEYIGGVDVTRDNKRKVKEQLAKVFNKKGEVITKTTLVKKRPVDLFEVGDRLVIHGANYKVVESKPTVIGLKRVDVYGNELKDTLYKISAKAPAGTPPNQKYVWNGRPQRGIVLYTGGPAIRDLDDFATYAWYLTSPNGKFTGKKYKYRTSVIVKAPSPIPKVFKKGGSHMCHVVDDAELTASKIKLKSDDIEFDLVKSGDGWTINGVRVTAKFGAW